MLYGEATVKIKQLESEQQSLESAKAAIQTSGKSDTDHAMQQLDSLITDKKNEILCLKYARLEQPPASIFDEHFESGGREVDIADMVKDYFEEGEVDADD